ncbi:Hypothetical predicted protein [Mytilus galloprovincialis]|uniref:Uncharacterized protein n=1 Tax=Mytilus galloprovincialis TaxID=29158 RepID=A0A8B6FMN1_MYTGA|nr:Hypothetical predicted protein [Mytilus galloprovincialis]
MRKLINDFLNELEEDLLNDLESKHSKLKSDMDTLVLQMEHQASRINQMQSQFTKMTQYATELQMYIGVREIASQATKYFEDFASAEEKNLEVNISSALQSIFQNVKSFGDININTTASTLQIKTGRKDQAQHLVPKVPGIEQIKPNLLTTLTLPEDMKHLDIYTCLILPDGTFIILDNYKKQLVLFRRDGSFIRKVVTFTGYPMDVCFVRKNAVAVTLEYKYQTVMVEVKENKILQTIKLSHCCNGVTSDGKTLIISGGQSTRINLNYMSHTILEGMGGLGPIAISQVNIYGLFPLKTKSVAIKVQESLSGHIRHKTLSNQKDLL